MLVGRNLDSLEPAKAGIRPTDSASKFAVTLLVPSLGRYKLQVTVDGQPIFKSPFTIDVGVGPVHPPSCTCSISELGSDGLVEDECSTTVVCTFDEFTNALVSGGEKLRAFGKARVL